MFPILVITEFLADYLKKWHLRFFSEKNMMDGVAYTTDILFLTVLEAVKSKTKVTADRVSHNGLLPGSQTAVFSLCPHMVKGRELFGTSFVRALIPFMRAPPS